MGSKDCAMVTNRGSLALKEEDIELELGLSIGGSYKRQNSTYSKSDQSCIRSSVSPRSCHGDFVQEMLDPKVKRKILALRRQEAKKKIEEKQLKKGSCNGHFNGCQLDREIKDINKNGMRLKAKVFQAKERVAETEERQCKKSKTGDIGSDHNDENKMNLNLCVDQIHGASYPAPSTSSPVQYGPPANGFVFPFANVNAIPCWFTGADEKTFVQGQQPGSHGFVQFQAALKYHILGNGYASEQNGGRDGGNKQAGPDGSTICTSFTSSDHRSFSHEGGGSSDTRSHSSPSEHTVNQVEKVIQSNSPQSSILEPKEAATIKIEPYPINDHISTPETARSVENKADMVGKRPKPQTQNHNTHTSSSLLYMPCVSTTGNGSNGKTINGFLYRYTKTEVSIICVCHGTSFSPAEFVRHAGGTDVSHPLRHITVIPSAF